MPPRRAYTIFDMRYALALLAVLTLSCGDAGFRSISTADLEDKIAGGWAGQMIGVSYGAPTEFRHLEKIIPEDELPVWEFDTIRNALDQDDLYVDMTFAQVLDDKGQRTRSSRMGLIPALRPPALDEAQGVEECGDHRGDCSDVVPCGPAG